ncbi:sigma-70 family RNA polymerase sigma factor [Streptomyces sp. NPDC000594]|uniref:sigma-70 family RNA polymerase sigma factor n=1 Tax=Streptomyces sp. NPDC000594 TaxID=3154261 RepID=UPI00332CBFAF
MRTSTEHAPTAPRGARPPADPRCPTRTAGRPGEERDTALARLFEDHYPALLRLAALLGADDPENIVAEAYYETYRGWRRLRDAERAASYLRSVVCNLTRMRIRHLQIVRKHSGAALAEPPVVSAESTALRHDDQRALVTALQRLPARQREALVLRHWMGLKEGEIAKAMGISPGSVKTHTARGIAALTQVLGNRRPP